MSELYAAARAQGYAEGVRDVVELVDQFPDIYSNTVGASLRDRVELMLAAAAERAAVAAVELVQE